MRSYPSFRFEMEQALSVCVDSARVVTKATDFSVLKSHANYSLGELIGALGDEDVSKARSLPREGVRYFESRNLDLFLVTFQKGEDVSASTNYRDYPKSPELPHWESQSQTVLSSKTAQRYSNHQERDSSILVATRFKKKNSFGMATAYTLLGAVDYVDHRGEKPIQFDWKLQRPMPEALYIEGRTVA